MTTPKPEKGAPAQPPAALRNLVTAQEALARAARRLAGVRRQAPAEGEATAASAGRAIAQR